ncbi:MAG: hypothetical protein GY839_13355 [candidate division Zixibacteria bacterium]|nr:hypothetical protein [candidate division Zixibacteria bacterium]
MIELNCGIRVGSELIIDPTRVQEAAAVSHAHSDHIKRHKTIFATPPTLELARYYIGDFTGVPIEYGKTYNFNSSTIRPEPAGHILGSAQFVMDYSDYRIVYTGDFKLSPNDTCAPAEIHKCDILFIDTTFGKKRFNFPDYNYLKQRLIEFVDAAIHSGDIPIIFAYNCGKAQEVMKILGDAGFNTYGTETAMANADIHSKYGVDIKNYHELSQQYPENGAIVVPPNYKFLDDLFPNYHKRTCFTTGWALYRSYIRMRYVDELIPLSDHASYNDLIRYVEEANPRKIYCLFGFKDIVDDLKMRGYNAVKATMANRKNIDRYVLKEMDMFRE